MSPDLATGERARGASRQDMVAAQRKLRAAQGPFVPKPLVPPASGTTCTSR